MAGRYEGKLSTFDQRNRRDNDGSYSQKRLMPAPHIDRATIPGRRLRLGPTILGWQDDVLQRFRSNLNFNSPEVINRDLEAFQLRLDKVFFLY